MVGLAGAVVATSGVVASGILTNGAMTGMVTGTVVGILDVVFTKGTTGAIVAKSTAVGATASAILGSVVATRTGAAGSNAIGGAIVASMTGGGAAAAINSVYGGAIGLVSGTAAGILSGPVGWLVLGTKEEESSGLYNFDCWKQILHDDSPEPSIGKTLREIAIDSRIKQVITTTMTGDDHNNLPHLIFENIWDEQFRIDYVELLSKQLATHAVKI